MQSKENTSPELMARTNRHKSVYLHVSPLGYKVQNNYQKHRRCCSGVLIKNKNKIKCTQKFWVLEREISAILFGHKG